MTTTTSFAARLLAVAGTGLTALALCAAAGTAGITLVSIATMVAGGPSERIVLAARNPNLERASAGPTLLALAPQASSAKAR